MVSLKYIIVFLSALLLPGAISAQALQDSGTSADGKFIFPKDMAMFCGISSHDANSSSKIENCLNKILRLSHGKETYLKEYAEMFNAMYRQQNSDFYDLAVQTKASAGDVDSQIEEQVDDKVSSKGAKKDDSQNVSNAQYKNGLLSKMASYTLLDLTDVTASLNMLQDMKDIHYLETSGNAAEISED